MPVSPSSSLPPLVTLRPWIERFSGIRVAVWGDIVADRFLYGSTTRVSREAPALVLCYESEEVRPGGAANAMMNAAGLGARVTAMGYLGEENVGKTLRSALTAGGVSTDELILRQDAHTPVKTRVMAGGHHTVRQQVLRIDEDQPWPRNEETEQRLVGALAAGLDNIDAMLISDYGLGSVDGSLYSELHGHLGKRSLPVTLDSRSALLEFRGVTAATPNEAEVERAMMVQLDGHPENLQPAGEELLDRLGCEALLITRGSCGMTVFERSGPTVHLPIHGSDQIADVTGAGDAVIAVFTLGLAAGATTLEAARLANVVGGLAVMKRGTATISQQELAEAVERGS
ncbi:MAG: bifunctional heptose 7-phosphate kinase/heptose 1-phosphate adenyltransferase [Acidobacteriota bacterium]